MFNVLISFCPVMIVIISIFGYWRLCWVTITASQVCYRDLDIELFFFLFIFMKYMSDLYAMTL